MITRDFLILLFDLQLCRALGSKVILISSDTTWTPSSHYVLSATASINLVRTQHGTPQHHPVSSSALILPLRAMRFLNHNMRHPTSAGFVLRSLFCHSEL